MNIGAVAGKTREIPVEFDGGEIATITIDPMKYTPGLEAQFEEIAASQFQSKALRLFCQEVITEWDLTKDGEPIPLTEEGINTVPVPILAQLIEGIKKDQTPTSEEGKASGGGSQQTATREGSLTGTR